MSLVLICRSNATTSRLVAFWLRWRYDCLGSLVVYLTTLFALTAGVSTGFAAVVILNAGTFAEASRQLVKYVLLQTRRQKAY